MKKFILFMLCGIVLFGVCGCNKKEVLQTNTRDEKEKQVEVITEYINIREENNVSSKILGKVYKGEIYTIISEDTSSPYKWLEIVTGNGIKGFISGKSEYVKFLEVIDNDNTVDIEKPKEEENTSNNNTSNNDNKKPVNSTKPSTNNNTNSNSNNNSNNNESIPNDNNSSSSDNSSNDNSIINTPTTDKEVEKKVINATKSDPYCKKGNIGYSDAAKTKPRNCYEDIYDKEALVISCATGYTLNESKTLCEKGEDRDNVSATKVPKCSDGGMLFQETTTGAYGCKSGILYYDYVCPTGYKYERGYLGGVTIHTCTWQNPYKVKAVTHNCTKGNYDRETMSCKYFVTSELSYDYSCPSGYTLKADKCYEN